MQTITTLDEANDAVNNDLLLKVTNDGPERTRYFATSSDGWQEGHERLGSPSHKTVDVEDVRHALLNAIEGDSEVTAVSIEDTPWGRSRHNQGIAL